MEDLEKFKQYLQLIQVSASKMLEILEDSDENNFKSNIKSIEKSNSFIPDWNMWPEAVPSFLIEEPNLSGMIKRARSILNMHDLVDLNGKHFLDFGCGEGHTTKEALERGAATATGFDIVRSNNWNNYESIDDLIMTCDFKDLDKVYSVVLLHDVLDHLVEADPIDVLKKIKGLIDGRGEVRIRCHPYTSRHANHVYNSFNKAYSHFFLTPEQLSEHNPLPVYKITGKDPMTEYKRWFNKAGFDVKKELPTKQDLDGFYLKNENRQQLKSVVNHEKYVEILEIQFVDYCIVPK